MCRKGKQKGNLVPWIATKATDSLNVHFPTGEILFWTLEIQREATFLFISSFVILSSIVGFKGSLGRHSTTNDL